ncbi:hypothetical protein BKA81DRAFT_134673 [Phyllosticta paracitricarpa]
MRQTSLGCFIRGSRKGPKKSMSKGRLGRWKRQATRRTSMLQPRVLHPIPSLRRADEKPRSATLARLVAEGTMTCRALFLSDRRADRVSQARLFGRAEAGVDRDSCPMAGEKREGGISTTIIQCSTASAVLCLLQGLLPPAFHNLTRNCGWASSSGRQEPHCCCLPVRYVDAAQCGRRIDRAARQPDTAQHSTAQHSTAQHSFSLTVSQCVKA